MVKCQYMKKIFITMYPIPHALILLQLLLHLQLLLFLVLAFRTYKELGTDNIEQMKGVPSDDSN